MTHVDNSIITIIITSPISITITISITIIITTISISTNNNTTTTTPISITIILSPPPSASPSLSLHCLRIVKWLRYHLQNSQIYKLSLFFLFRINHYTCSVSESRAGFPVILATGLGPSLTFEQIVSF